MMKRLREEKAMKIDEVQNEVWLWRKRRRLRAAMKKIARGYRRRRDSGIDKKSIVIPLAKKRRAKKVEKHRSFMLLLSAYKKYASVLVNRLEKKTERKKILPQ